MPKLIHRKRRRSFRQWLSILIKLLNLEKKGIPTPTLEFSRDFRRENSRYERRDGTRQ